MEVRLVTNPGKRRLLRYYYTHLPNVKVKVMMSNNKEDKKKVAISISMMEASLPPGFRFHPRDEELISDYLSNKVASASTTATATATATDDDHDDDDDDDHHPLLPQVDLNHCEPWDLPEMACVGGKEWYFYSQRDRKYATGLRTNRATVSGYWKATGKDRCILDKQIVVGMRKTLVFYLGRAPKGKKTDWVMHEFRLQSSPNHHSSLKDKDQDWVLCRVFCKNRELVGGQQINHEDTQSCSSISLPPLMDPNYYHNFSFDPPVSVSVPVAVSTTNINDIFNNHEQVPCFSTNNNPIVSSNTIRSIPPIPSSSISSISQSLDHYSSCCDNSNSNSNKEVFKSILSRFNEQLDHHHHECTATTLSFAQGISDQSFLCDAALPVTMWYP